MKDVYVPGAYRMTFIFLAIGFFICSCGGLMRSGMKENDKQIPIGFGKEAVTILAVRKTHRYNEWLEKRFSENYFGKYIIIDEYELTGAKYQNTDVYRYIFDERESVHLNTVTNSSINKSMADELVSFSLKDRISGKIYKTASINGAPTAVMRDYLISLEKVRKRNAVN